MVKVLVIGATGYIGTAICSYLRQSNHRVYGLARSPEKAEKLIQREVIAIEGSVEDASKYLQAIEQYKIDIVVDLSGTPTSTRKIIEDLKPIAQSRISSHGNLNKLGFIYCSGIWVHGSSYDPVNDLEIVGVGESKTSVVKTAPPQLVQWRPDLEDHLISSEIRNLFNVVILRPGLVYGGISPIWSIAWTPLVGAIADNSNVSTIPLDRESAPSLIHVDDVATGFKSVVENISSLSSTYPIFDLTTSFESLELINRLAARALGFTGEIKYEIPEDDSFHILFAKAFGSTINASSERLSSLTGWKATRISMAADVDLYTRAWASANGHLH